MTDSLVTIVVPFFQNERGILTKAVRSALRQKDFDDYLIVVVDDQSPVPARDELGKIIDEHPNKIHILERTNGGPGAARNTALDSLPAETPYVAFLDSDDEWTDTHLRNAIDALEQGYDCYFADHFQLGSEVSAFKRAGRLNLAEHTKLKTYVSLYEFSKDMFDQILMGNLIGTSTVVYRFRKFRHLRFRERFRMAGEDYIFWLELSRAGARYVFSPESECAYGKGVNVYSGSGWGTDKYLDLVHDEIKYRKFIIDFFALNKRQRRLLDDRISSLRASFALGLLHDLKRGKLGAIAKFIQLARMDGSMWPRLPFLLARAAARRPVRDEAKLP